jgi:hypothetical protein
MLMEETYFVLRATPFEGLEGVLKSPGELLGPDLLILVTDGVSNVDFRFELPLTTVEDRE